DVPSTWLNPHTRRRSARAFTLPIWSAPASMRISIFVRLRGGHRSFPSRSALPSQSDLSARPDPPAHPLLMYFQGMRRQLVLALFLVIASFPFAHAAAHAKPPVI